MHPADYNPRLGCYGDGAFGHQHTRERCADMLESIKLANGQWPSVADIVIAELVVALRGPMSDDASEEDAACELAGLMLASEGRMVGLAGWGLRTLAIR